MPEEVLLMEGCPVCEGDLGDAELGYDLGDPGRTRYCVAVKPGRDGSCKCAKYAPGPRPEGAPTFKELCERAGLPIVIGGRRFSGAEVGEVESLGETGETEISEGGIGMARKCVRFKEVYSPVLGKWVKRCADYEGAGLSGLGAISDLIPPNVMNTAKTAALAAAGAVLVDRIVDYVAPKLNIVSTTSRTILTIGVGLLAGGLAYKFTRRMDVATALAMGPITLAVYSAVSPMLASPAQQPALPAAEGLGLITTERTPSVVYEMPARPLTQIPAFAGR